MAEAAVDGAEAQAVLKSAREQPNALISHQTLTCIPARPDLLLIMKSNVVLVC